MKKAYKYLTFIVAAVLGTACAKTPSVDGPENGEPQESRIGFGTVVAKAAEVTPDAAKPLQIQVYDYFTPAAEGSAETEYIDELIQESETEGVWAFVKEGKKNSYSWKRGEHVFFGWVATDEAGRTRSYRLPKAFQPIGLTERKPSRWRRKMRSAASLERTSSAITSF